MSQDIYQYLDYRQYLADTVQALKADRSFTVREFATKAGIKAPGYLKMVIDGKRNLTAETAHKFCRALDIAGKARIYFETLVHYNQSTDPDLKREYFDALQRLRPRSAALQLDQRQQRYFSRPYYACIREMVTLKGFTEDAKWIAHRCFPAISPADATEAIDTLLEIGLLRRSDKGALEQTEEFVQTEDINTQAIEAYHFHEAVLDKARHALAKLPQNERNYYAMILPLPKPLFSEFIRDFYKLRDQMIEKMQNTTQEYDEVYHINFQLFPATQRVEEDS